MQFASQHKAVHQIASQAQAQGTTISATGQDASGYAEAIGVFNLGAIASGLGPTIRLQESDDNSAWTNFSTDAALPLADTDDNETKAITVKLDPSNKKYVRGQSTVPGGTGTVQVSADLVLARPHGHVAAPAMTADKAV